MSDHDLKAEASAVSIGVRELCDFSARAGDLDLRFGMSPNAREGMAGHLVVASRRGAEYKSEVTLKGSLAELSISGRADGYSAAQNRLEEIKTFRGIWRANLLTNDSCIGRNSKSTDGCYAPATRFPQLR